jgi:hypothetical protein
MSIPKTDRRSPRGLAKTEVEEAGPENATNRDARYLSVFNGTTAKLSIGLKPASAGTTVSLGNVDSKTPRRIDLQPYSLTNGDQYNLVFRRSSATPWTSCSGRFTFRVTSPTQASYTVSAVNQASCVGPTFGPPTVRLQEADQIKDFRSLLQATAADAAQGLSIHNANTATVTVSYSADNKQTWKSVGTVSRKSTKIFDLRSALGGNSQGPIFIRYKLGTGPKTYVVGAGWFYEYAASPLKKASYTLSRVNGDVGPTYEDR